MEDTDKDTLQLVFTTYKLWKGLKAELEEATAELDLDDHLRLISNLLVKTCEEIQEAENERGAAPELEAGSGTSSEEGSGEVSCSAVGTRRESEVEGDLEHANTT